MPEDGTCATDTRRIMALMSTKMRMRDFEITRVSLRAHYIGRRLEERIVRLGIFLGTIAGGDPMMRFVAVAVCVLLLRLSCFAWDASGHRIVARIAARNLSPAVKPKVAAILGASVAGLEAAMAAASTWP